VHAGGESFGFDSDADPIGKVLIGLDGRYLRVNPAMCRFTGHTEAELLGLTVASTTHPDDLAADDEARQRLLTGVVETYTLDKRYLSASGGFMWVTKTVSLARDATGTALHFIAQVQNINARKEQEEALNEERRRLRDAQIVGRLGSWELDIDTTAVTWSDMIFELYGLDRANFDGDLTAALNCVHPDDRQMVFDALAVCAASGEPMRAYYRVIRQNDGQVRSMDARGRRLRDDAGILRLVGTAADVTEVVEQVRADAEARVAFEFQQSILAATPDIIFVYDMPSRATVWSNRSSMLVERKRGAATGPPDETPQDVVPGDVAGLDAALAASCETRDGEITQFDYDVPQSDGSIRGFSQRTTPLRRDGNGDVVQLAGSLRDITALNRIANALAESEERFRLAFATAPVGMAMVELSETGRLVQVNPAMRALTGQTEAELLSSDMQGLLYPDGPELALLTLEQLRTSDAADGHVESRLFRADGSVVWGQIAISVVPASDGRAAYGICLIADITARKLAEVDLLHLGLHDPLTGLPNRTLLYDRLEHTLAASQRSRRRVGIIYIDLDGFKAVNDSDGHAAGDELLVQAAERLRRTVRPGDTVGRIGGDEFAVICIDVENIESLQVAAGRALDVLSEAFDLATGRHHISGSIGLSLSDDASDPDQLLADADAAMYAAKNGGKNRIALPRLEDQARAGRAARLGAELSRALSEDELIMHGQPVVDLATGRIVAVETLIRWQHPTRGLLPPSEFLDSAEHGPLMIAVGRRALNESCRMAASWCERLGALAPDLHVNVSGRQLESGNITNDILTTLATYGLPASRLVLELTETHMPTLTNSLLADITMLRNRGVRIAIDDIGTGYSSLIRLTELPVDVLKIDLKFIAGLGHDPACAAVVRAVLSLGQEMGLSVIAEGVETPVQAAILASYGCDTVQGYLYSPPRPEAEMTSLLAASTQLPQAV
jgi:diguanylate cyclase (GGDEF)-like protein/PAS domain S-box-containing protein